MNTYLVEELEVGMITGDAVFSKHGQLILPRNSVLTRQMISHLKFYGIREVTILEGDPPEAVQQSIERKLAAERTRHEKLLATPEYIKFKQNYTRSVAVLEQALNDIILKNAPVDEPNLLSQTLQLYMENSTSYSVFGMLHSMKKIDDSTYAHSINVSIICRLIGTWLNLPEKDLDQLTLAGLLHDIGKCQIPKDILLKPGKLSKSEYEFIKKHPEFGYQVLKNHPIDERIKQSVLLHHERCDGSGYPFGYDSTKLSEFECIVSIADVYDAMTSNRCYRSALCPFDVISTFEQEGLNKYHPMIIITFLEKIANSYLNSDILLNDDSTARIIYTNNTHLTRPIVQHYDGSIIKLEERPDLYIQAII